MFFIDEAIEQGWLQFLTPDGKIRIKCNSDSMTNKGKQYEVYKYDNNCYKLIGNFWSKRKTIKSLWKDWRNNNDKRQ